MENLYDKTINGMLENIKKDFRKSFAQACDKIEQKKEKEAWELIDGMEADYRTIGVINKHSNFVIGPEYKHGLDYLRRKILEETQ